jgi:hypothetical protein
MLNVPVVAFRLTVALNVDVPVPLIDVGLKLMVVPLFWPDADSEIEEMVPEVTVVEMVDVPEDPRATVSEVGFAPIVKFEGAAVTVKLTVVVSTVPSLPVPVTVTAFVPVVAVPVAVNVRIELPLLPIVAGL